MRLAFSLTPIWTRIAQNRAQGETQSHNFSQYQHSVGGDAEHCGGGGDRWGGGGRSFSGGGFQR